MRHDRNRAEERGPLRFGRAGAEDFKDLFDAFLRLHGACWLSRGQPGVLASEAVRNFHREAAPALLALGVLRLYALRLGDRIVASYYGFLHRARAYAYLTGFDPGIPDQSLGTLVLGCAIEEAVREGARECHFLRGNEAYKYGWGPEDRWNHSRKLWHGPAPIKHDQQV